MPAREGLPPQIVAVVKGDGSRGSACPGWPPRARPWTAWRTRHTGPGPHRRSSPASSKVKVGRNVAQHVVGRGLAGDHIRDEAPHQQCGEDLGRITQQPDGPRQSLCLRASNAHSTAWSRLAVQVSR